MLLTAPRVPVLLIAVVVLAASRLPAQDVKEQLEKLGRQRAAWKKSDAGNPATQSKTLTHLGKQRHYLLHLPTGETPKKSAPLVIALHGAFTDGAITEALTQFSPMSDRESFVVVYPNANPKGGIGVWDFFSPAVADAGKRADGRMATGRDDVGFIAALIEDLVKQKLVDPTRVYVTGISNGSYMANRLAVDLGDRIAATAGVAGTGGKIALFVKPPHEMPVFYIHGDRDKVIGIDGTDFVSKANLSLTADEFCRWWARRNGCQAPKTESLPDRDKSDGCTVERTTWKPKGKSGAPVILYRIKGGGHTWPGDFKFQPRAILGNTCRDIDASKLMWEFFQQHSRK